MTAAAGVAADAGQGEGSAVDLVDARTAVTLGAVADECVRGQMRAQLRADGSS